jgi:hypothetical protein
MGQTLKEDAHKNVFIHLIKLSSIIKNIAENTLSSIQKNNEQEEYDLEHIQRALSENKQVFRNTLLTKEGLLEYLVARKHDDLDSVLSPNRQFFERLVIARGDISELLGRDQFREGYAQELAPTFTSYSMQRRNATILNVSEVARFRTRALRGDNGRVINPGSSYRHSESVNTTNEARSHRLAR